VSLSVARLSAFHGRSVHIPRVVDCNGVVGSFDQIYDISVLHPTTLVGLQHIISFIT